MPKMLSFGFLKTVIECMLNVLVLRSFDNTDNAKVWVQCCIQSEEQC